MAKAKETTKFKTRYESKKHKEGGGFTPCEEGRYLMKAVEGVFKESKKPTEEKEKNEYLELIFQVIDGPEKGSKIYCLFNLYNSNPTARRIAEEDLKHYIIQAFGRELNVKNAKELLNKPVYGNVIITKSKGYKPKNEITSFESISKKKGKGKGKAGKKGKKTGKKKDW